MTATQRHRSRLGPALRLPLLAPALAAFVVMAGAQIAVPLTTDDRTLSTIVVVAFALTTGFLAARSWGIIRSVVAFVVVVPLTLAIEKIGTATGVPFGDYRYTGALQPTIASVPVIVPLAWFAMAGPALEVASRVAPGRLGRIALGSVALTAWDLFLDPQMVGEGYWEWTVDGPYRGIPASNYVGWLLAGFVVMAVLDRLRPDRARSTLLLALYAWWTVLSTIGFVVFFGDPLVGVAGGAGMGVCLVAAVRAPARAPAAASA